MKRSPEELEKFIHQTLRALPERRAPRSLEDRVLAAIAARASLPWWKQSYAQWPLAARCAFLIGSGAIVHVALMAAVWVMSGAEGARIATSVAAEFAWVARVNAAIEGISHLFSLIVRSIPPVWLYGSLAVFAAVYALLFGLGATAYRTLYAHR